MSKPTPGKWMPGHLTDEDAKCNCQYILGEGYMGAIATVHVGDPDDHLSDHPPEEEAKKNMELISAAGTAANELEEYDPVELMKALPELIETVEGLMPLLETQSSINHKKVQKILNKAYDN